MAKKVAVLAVNPVNGLGLFTYLETFYENKIEFKLYAVSDTTAIHANSGVALKADDVVFSLKGHADDFDALVFSCGDAIPAFQAHASESYNLAMVDVIREFAAKEKLIIGHCAAALIFEKANLPLWYAYTTFIALLLSALLWYFFNYKMILLSADQKEYKITYCTQGIKIVKVLLQMWAVMSLFNGYVYWIVLEVLMTIVSSVVLSRVIKREYPWLCSVSVDGKTLQRKYREIIRKTKQVFFHKIANLVLLQTSPLIIYAYASLTLVTIYGNYMMIVSAVTTLMGALLSGINAGIGNLVAEGNREKIKSVFWQLTTLRMWLASIICFGIYMFGHSFVKLWVGDGFQMPQSAFVVLLVITFIQLTRVDAFISAYGLYQDIWAPVIEVLLNLSLSILLGYYYGLAGILAGVLISLVVIVEIWKPYFLYQCGFNDNVWEYVLFFSKKIFLLFLCFALLVWFSEFTVNLVSDTYLHWCINLVKLLFEYIIISFLFLYCLDASLRNIAKRFFGMWMAHFKRKS